jgi:hypothetical protein
VNVSVRASVGSAISAFSEDPAESTESHAPCAAVLTRSTTRRFAQAGHGR